VPFGSERLGDLRAILLLVNLVTVPVLEQRGIHLTALGRQVAVLPFTGDLDRASITGSRMAECALYRAAVSLGHAICAVVAQQSR